ncbi:MAG: DUF58 domain-containing protein [Phycisphaerae bacterium]|nr:DUF58 domain-containing protein [Phycisphaerae bacterium]
MSDGGHRELTHHGGRIDASTYLHPQTLARLGSFELRAKHIVEGVMSGQHRSPYTGYSVEFAQHRPYSPGDDLRHLDWKVYARTDRLQIKQYQQETNLDLIVLVDASGSMSYGTRSFADASGEGRNTSADGRAHWSKFDHATALAAALSYITLQQGDRVGLATFSDELMAIVNRSGSRSQWRKIVEVLSGETVTRQTELGRVTDQALGQITGRCLVVVMSDFFESLDTLRGALARMKHRGHDVICFQVLDKAERTFDFADAAPFEGLEGEGLLKVSPRAVRKAYIEQIEAHIAGFHRLCRGFGFDHEVVSTHDWLGPPLASFVARRASAMKRSKFG